MLNFADIQQGLVLLGLLCKLIPGPLFPKQKYTDEKYYANANYQLTGFLVSNSIYK